MTVYIVLSEISGYTTLEGVYSTRNNANKKVLEVQEHYPFRPNKDTVWVQCEEVIGTDENCY